MARVKVGIIDDGYPTTETHLSIDEINELTMHCEWGSEVDLKDLNIRLVSESLRWKKKIEIQAFKHPNFYFNGNDWNWDFLVYDWEYNPDANSDEDLYEILTKTSCPIYIYTAWDKFDDIPLILNTARFQPYQQNNRYKLLNKSETVSEETILKDILKAFQKGEDVHWNDINIKLFPSKYIIDFDEFWKLQFLLGSETLYNYLKENNVIDENAITKLFAKSPYKFFIDEHKSILSSSNNELLVSAVGKLTEISMLDTLKSIGIDKMEEAKEKGYIEIR
jgi:hypothetical protein